MAGIFKITSTMWWVTLYEGVTTATRSLNRGLVIWSTLIVVLRTSEKLKPNLRKVMDQYLFFAVVPQAIKLAPVDTSNLRRLITSEVI